MARLLTPNEVAERLAVDADHVRALIRSRKLLAVNVSNGKRPTYRVEEEQLAAFLDASRELPRGTSPRFRPRGRKEDLPRYF